MNHMTSILYMNLFNAIHEGTIKLRQDYHNKELLERNSPFFFFSCKRFSLFVLLKLHGLKIPFFHMQI
jgi:hypothetical protein